MSQKNSQQHQFKNSHGSTNTDPSIHRIQRSVSPKMLSNTLYIFSLSLLFAYAVSLGFQLFPINLSSPQWQLRIAGALVSAAPSALGGLVILQLSAFVDRDNESLQKDWHSIGRWGLLAVLGFPLLIPIQLMAVFTTISGNSAIQDSRLIDSTLKSLISCLFFALFFAAATPTWNDPTNSYLMKWQNHRKFLRFKRMRIERPFW